MRMCVCKSSLAIVVIQKEKTNIYDSEPMKNLGKQNNIPGPSLQTWYNLDKKVSVVASENKLRTFQNAHKEKVRAIGGTSNFANITVNIWHLASRHIENYFGYPELAKNTLHTQKKGRDRGCYWVLYPSLFIYLFTISVKTWNKKNPPYTR